jgi:hypothetical protein
MIAAIWRVLVVVAGLGVIAAATHANIEHAGGYAGKDTWLIITIAALLALGMGYAAITWQEGRYLGAVALALCLLCGEAYWLAVNLEREIAAREELAAPLVAQQAQRTAAEKRLADAETAKRTADAAAISEAAKPGCRKNCAQLLTDAKTQADEELTLARAALAALPMARTVAPLPERLGIASWLWDMILSILRSIAVIGGSIAVALAIHPRRPEHGHKAPSAPATINRETAAILEPVISLPKSSPAATDHREHVAAFLRAVLRPDPTGATSLRRLHGTYLDWCRGHDAQPLPPAELGQHLRAIVDAIGLEVEPEGQDVVVRGAALAA